MQYALSYCFLKLVTYSLLFWLPFYLFEGAGLPKALAALMATGAMLAQQGRITSAQLTYCLQSSGFGSMTSAKHGGSLV